MDYDEETENDANNNGQLFCDKDTFLQLYKESKSLNPFLMESNCSTYISSRIFNSSNDVASVRTSNVNASIPYFFNAL
jgi:hypothetical protein